MTAELEQLVIVYSVNYVLEIKSHITKLRELSFPEQQSVPDSAVECCGCDEQLLSTNCAMITNHMALSVVLDSAHTD